MRPVVVVGCAVVALGVGGLGVAAWTGAESEDVARDHLGAFEEAARDAESRQETGLAIENARVAGVERGLEEARSLFAMDRDRVDAILEVRRAALETEARSAASQIADADAGARRQTQARLMEADRVVLTDEIGAFGRGVLLSMLAVAASVLIVTAWLLGRRQRALAASLAVADAAVRTGTLELARTREDLERSVDEKTAALGAALDEARDLNVRLKDAQDQLVRQEKMAALGTLAGGIAHEFNNLLGGIRGCAEDLREETSDAAAQETLDVVVRAARRGRTIVEGLMTFSQAGGKEPQPVELGGVVSDVFRLVASAAQEQGVRLEDMGVAEDVTVSGDPVQLHQVVLNLVQNAIQASPEGGVVEVEVVRGGARVLLRVKDRGRGIRPDHAPRVFEPFFTTRELDGGTGLGLAITHGIVQGHLGTLAFEDRDGGGTLFVVDLPYAGRR